MGGRLTVLIAVTAFLLTGCAASHADPHPSPTTGESGTASPAPEPGPAVRVDAACSDFMDVATAAALLANASDVQPVATTTGFTLQPFAEQQYGTLECEWAPSGVPSTSDYISVTVAPDVTDAQWSDVHGLISGSTGVVSGGFPGDSYSNCLHGPQGRSCILDTRIGDWWLEVAMQSSESAAEGEARTWGNPLLHHSADVVAALPEAAPTRWQPPGGTPAAVECGGVVGNGSLASDLGYSNVDVAFVGPTQQAGASWVGLDAVGNRTCYLQGIQGDAAQNFGFEVLPGGTWAWDDAVKSAGATAPLDGIGDQAVSFTANDGQAAVLLRFGSYLAVTTAAADGAPANADLAHIAQVTAKHLAAAAG